MPSKSAKPRRPDLREQASARRVAIVAFPGVTLLDISGPAQVFAELQEIELPSASYSLSYLSTAGGLVPTDVGMMIDTAPIASVRPNQVDTLVIPGGPGIWELRQDAVLMKWIVETLPKARRVASVCLGAFVLAWTGALDGKRAATHWRYCPRLADGFPAVRVEPNAIFVKDGRVWSSAGVSAGIDLALAMIEEDFGHTTALDIARRLVVFLKRPGGQSQFSTVLAAQASDVEGRFSALHAWIIENITGDLKVETLAEKAGMTSADLCARLCQPHRNDAGQRRRGAAGGDGAAVARKPAKPAAWSRSRSGPASATMNGCGGPSCATSGYRLRNTEAALRADPTRRLRSRYILARRDSSSTNRLRISGIGASPMTSPVWARICSARGTAVYPSKAGPPNRDS